MPDADDELTPAQKATVKLYEDYRRKFGEWPPSFGIGARDEEAVIKEALKTGKRITVDVPPGSYA